MPDLAQIAAAARGLFPSGVAVSASDPGTLYPLFPGEVLPGAVPARLREFSAGRHAARTALAAMGHPHKSIPMAGDRAPLWPAGTVGSITHSRTACLAATSSGASGLGLDLEDDAPLDRDLWDTILLPAEQEWAASQPDPGRVAKLIFSAKEAAYKAQYAASSTVFGFHALETEFGEASFTATFLQPVGPFRKGLALPGRFTFAEGHILTAVLL